MDNTPKAHGQETKDIPHSGAAGYEQPVRPYDKTPLPEAVKEYHTDTDGNIIVPKNPSSLTGESEAPKKKRTKLIAGIAAGVLALGIGTGVGVSFANNGQEENPNTPPEKNPNDNSQVEEEPAPVEEEPTIETPELIASLQETTWETFSASPRAEQVAYSHYRIKTNSELHAEGVGDDDRTTWTEPSHDMTAQQIVDNFNYVRDESGFSYKIVDGTGDKVLDKDEAIKILSGAYYDNSGSVFSSKSFVNDRDFILGRDTLFITDQKQTVISESEIKQSDDRDGNPVESKEITVVDQSGYNITMEFFYVEYPDTDGNTASAWLFFQQQVNE